MAKGCDAAILLGPAGSIPKWLAQQQVCWLFFVLFEILVLIFWLSIGLHPQVAGTSSGAVAKRDAGAVHKQDAAGVCVVALNE